MATRPYLAALAGIALCMATSGTPAHALTDAEAAATNMQLAAELCLDNLRIGDMPGAFQQAGFALSPYIDPGTFEFRAHGVWGILAPGNPSGECTVQSQIVPIPMARAIGRAVVDRLYSGMVGEDDLVRPAGAPMSPCPSLILSETRPITIIGYSAAGNSGECIDDGSSAISISN